MGERPTPRIALPDTMITFDRKGRVIESGSPVLKSNNMIMVKPMGSRRKNDFPALDIRENQRNASPNPFNDDDEINLHAPTPVKYGNEPKENKTSTHHPRYNTGMNPRKTNCSQNRDQATESP